MGKPKFDGFSKKAVPVYGTASQQGGCPKLKGHE
jgi:hypothetical protein